MKISIKGETYIASARDIGNFAAGYVAGQNGLSWLGTRLGFDFYESIQKKGISREGKPSQYAQFRGYMTALEPLFKGPLLQAAILLTFKSLLP